MIKYAFSISEYVLVEDTQLITYANNQSQASSHVSYDVIGLRLGKKPMNLNTIGDACLVYWSLEYTVRAI